MPEVWVYLDTSGIREPVFSQGPLSSGKGQASWGMCEPDAAWADSGAWESLRELRALGTDDAIGQQLPSQVPSGVAQGPTGFSQ